MQNWKLERGFSLKRMVSYNYLKYANISPYTELIGYEYKIRNEIL